MKATGVVRRIDDLGRVVIPKEIRKTLRIKEGDPLEIFTDKEVEVILKAMQKLFPKPQDILHVLPIKTLLSPYLEALKKNF